MLDGKIWKTILTSHLVLQIYLLLLVTQCSQLCYPRRVTWPFWILLFTNNNNTWSVSHGATLDANQPIRVKIILNQLH